MKSSLLFLILFVGFSCTGKKASNIHLPSDSITTVDSVSLDSLWQDLVFNKGGCLTGGQRVNDGRFGGEGCVLTENRRVDWRPFFSHPKEELRDFLIEQIEDTSTSRIHTCPFMPASGGEVAVYCLTKIYLINWYDFDPFIEYQDREISSSMDSEQSWVQAILEDPKRREVLIEEWRKL
ncbi:MAG: hypothetical protein HRT58_01740 [Crocinitomicaceae bacterium]|nr:hypothetical protein [Flavobacteriales bacterium]NQZ34347.1 hypothetical protein [Crocinitomicaceae bacterium]